MSKKTQQKPFCAVPFVTAFTHGTGFRDCCSKHPQNLSQPKQDFQDWWHSRELENFRQQLMTSDQWPSGCYGCKIQEQSNGASFRSAINQEVGDVIDYSWPMSWNMNFGNICNLGCWICSERCSSVIQRHKTLADIPLSIQYEPQETFEAQWPFLKKQVLISYQHHDVVSLTILGGEPLYNDIVADFLQELAALGLSQRTRLYFHTNATVDPRRILQTKNATKWNYVCVFLSLDATGRYAEWLRYGSRWQKIEKNIPTFLRLCDYVEIHGTVSVLNINQLPALDQFATQQGIKLKLNLVSKPDFMSLLHWDLGRDTLLVQPTLAKFQPYYDLIGTEPVTGSAERLRSYIRSFDRVRDPLSSFDKDFAQKMGW